MLVAGAAVVAVLAVVVVAVAVAAIAVVSAGIGNPDWNWVLGASCFDLCPGRSAVVSGPVVVAVQAEDGMEELVMVVEEPLCDSSMV